MWQNILGNSVFQLTKFWLKVIQDKESSTNVQQGIPCKRTFNMPTVYSERLGYFPLLPVKASFFVVLGSLITRELICITNIHKFRYILLLSTFFRSTLLFPFHLKL